MLSGQKLSTSMPPLVATGMNTHLPDYSEQYGGTGENDKAVCHAPIKVDRADGLRDAVVTLKAAICNPKTFTQKVTNPKRPQAYRGKQRTRVQSSGLPGAAY